MIQGKRWLSSGKALVVLCLALLLGALSFGGYTPLARAVARVEPTLVTYFYPSSTVQATASGYCWIGSLAASRSDAWRCATGNIIYDPCFEPVASKSGSLVICNPNPATGQKGIRVNLNQPPPRAEAYKGQGTQAWLLVLANGSFCSFLTGATGLVNNQRIDYGCSDGSVVIGLPQTGKVWMAKVQAPGSNTLKDVPVKEAWL
ncbi:hypothetical protein KSD_64020 [Ktedonobacter sp. SOSP1-85]|uniref:hypothetical protein n=1 Tax=Ktedonobacter sp. SOSP1-85 TaxID=2778367 RepID=UPI001915A88F|nr:hypothetical protein [Ktedonobacter sp. SOSP1-85]GHO78631.1 hypothetical protein KSD_64020 [Ktedonobacter sp. SOSP1-85]